MNQAQAIAQVQAQNVGMFIVLFGEACNGYDIGVYKSKADSDADVADNGNDRLVDRVTVEIARLSDGALAPKFMAIAMNETNNWNKDAPGYDRAIAIAAGEIYGTFFYNARSVTHLCALAPTYELYRVDTLGNVRSHSDSHDGRYDVSVEDREWLDEWFTQANHEPILYIDCGVIDRIPLEPGHHQLIEDLATRPLEDLQELDTEGAIDEMTEYQSSNPTLC